MRSQKIYRKQHPAGKIFINNIIFIFKFLQFWPKFHLTQTIIYYIYSWQSCGKKARGIRSNPLKDILATPENINRSKFCLDIMALAERFKFLRKNRWPITLNHIHKIKIIPVEVVCLKAAGMRDAIKQGVLCFFW